MSAADSPVHIVLVEDNEGDEVLIQQVIEERSPEATVTVCRRFDTTLGYFREWTGPAPSLLLLDINLPDGDGLRLLDELRSMAQYAAMPVAVFSSSMRLEDQRRAEELRVLRFIEKPLDLDAFLLRVADLLDAVLGRRAG